jgi:transposase
LALVVLSVVEQRLDAVRAVLDGADVVEAAARAGVHRATLHRWIARYLTGQLAGLADRSHRPRLCPRQVSDVVEVAVAEMRREHPRWGSRRIRLEMLRKPGPWARQGLAVPSERTINRILHRQGLLRARPRKRPRDSYVRFERPGPMQLWQMDIVGGIRLVNPLTGELREGKVVTAVDDHSRYCVIAKVVERAASRAVDRPGFFRGPCLPDPINLPFFPAAHSSFPHILSEECTCRRSAGARCYTSQPIRESRA